VPSAVIIRARLPAGIERLRGRSLAAGTDSVPAHLTLLYPFIEPDGLDVSVRRRLAAIAADHRPFDYRLLAAARWPDTIYVTVAPVEPFVELQTHLAEVFPDYPIYGRPVGFAFVPHVTIAEGASSDHPATLADAAWADLPRPARASALDVIAGEGGTWRLVWRLRLGRPVRR
jgi:2'-5' RNA ligase